MKIRDLKFEPHHLFPGTWRARIIFPNGYGASVVTGGVAYSRPGQPYEIAILDKDGYLRYDTPITDNVCGYLTEAEADEILARIEALSPLMR